MINEYALAKDYVKEGFEVPGGVLVAGVPAKILSSRKGQVLDENSKPVLVEDGKITPLNYTSLFSHRFEIKYEDKPIGSVILYSSNRVVLNKVKISFIVYMINALIKTVTLWVLFIWAFNKFLTRQLNIFCEEMERIDLDNKTDYQLIFF